uniref:Uncharacterized protein n=1 Tax=Chromera velia CCMP2878 TaxID=1169474 RepID=A0A0G4GM15_9ALVE|eukprot:Cvel_22493.t1-p1 / transcript=Cvel_22493.t1 / gene=Cvel_22493 / organism=Chromera_velia_CCMP2878 / gene_product=26S proteasome non-ATPase regulatory subunit 2 1A, putative / transcript_product=26S proteasome non-ATPase regulatory subunit 2 1A, putative / location=Cvel_scaffold2216:18585-29458(-) / protein_length=885 / sequence_SO=supercontig / SO=protein_coding / is_pseudo=false
MGETEEKKKPPTKKEIQEEDLSEDDKRKKEEIELMVERIQDKDDGLVAVAIQTLSTELKTATSSMTSVPKPLKFLRPHFGTLKDHYGTLPDSENKRALADVLSVMSTTIPGAADERTSLKFRLEGTHKDVTSWGYEYLRNLSGEIASVYHDRQSQAEGGDMPDCKDLMELVDAIVPFNIRFGGESEAMDLLCEVDRVSDILGFADENNYAKFGAYLHQTSNYAAVLEDRLKILGVCFDLYMKHDDYPQALRMAMKAADKTKVETIFEKCKDEALRKQLSLMLVRQRVDREWTDEEEELRKLAGGETLNEHFLYLAKELDMMEPKKPADIYKTHLEERRGGSAGLDSARENLASTYVNAFVNAGYCKDALMMTEEESGGGWVFKNKEHGMTAAAASLGMILLWNVDEGLTQIDKYQWSSDNNVKAGAFMAFGLTSAGVKNEVDPAYALLADQLDTTTDAQQKIGIVVGLGCAYAGTHRADLLEALAPIVIDTSFNIEVSAMAALSLGLIFAGSNNDEACQSILQALLERGADEEQKQLDGSIPRLLAVGLGLLYLQQRDECQVVLEALDAITHPLGKYAKVTVETFAFAASGDVLKVQQLMHMAAEAAMKAEEEEDDEAKLFYQGAAILGLPLIALGEDVGTDMIVRALDRILQYGDVNLRRAVPLALALQSVSNPKVTIVDTLSKLTHDSDADVALHSIISLGLVGAGTNNSRIAGKLRQLAGYYAKDANAVFVVRLAQGLVYAGKGLLTLSPLHSDRSLVSPVALASLCAVTHGFLSLRETILGKHHYLMYYLVGALYPRFLVFVDEEMNPMQVEVRVGQAVDTVGMSGKPRAITGFQTHKSPVLLSDGDRAELGDDKYLPLSPVLEGVVVLRPNPNYKEKTEK